jgi:polyphosphate kinase
MQGSARSIQSHHERAPAPRGDGETRPDPPPVDLDDPSLYVNREMSWLAFNGRVLEEALRSRWPLLERLKFLAIYFSNLDEFFMIRVSGLHDQLEAELPATSPDRLTPREQLTRIGHTIRAQLEVASALLADTLLPALSERGIRIRDWSSLDAETKRQAGQYFRRSVFPVLTPLAVDPGHPFPFLSNLSVSLAVEARDPDSRDPDSADPDGKERRFARVKVPESLPRFIPLADFGRPSAGSSPSSPPPPSSPGHDGPHDFLPMEQLLAANLDDLFPGVEILGCYPFRVTRDMDIAILEDEAMDLLSVIDSSVRRRRFGACVRLEVSSGIPDRIRRLLAEKLEIDDEDVYQASGPLGLAALMSIAQINRPDLRDPPFVAATPCELADEHEPFREPFRDPFAAIRAGDILLHHPYDSFAPVLDFLKRAADDPKVLAIKMTLYRAGANSEAVRALIHAAENGKQVAVSIELKARFDEANNIAWARALEHAGAHVFFGDAALKTHAKLVLVVRQESDGLRRYVHMSTGNYNAGTARLYTDLGLLTANADLGEDVAELFNSLSGFSKKDRYRKLAVAPVGLVGAILAQIDEQAARARAGRPARIFAKLNAVVDVGVIQALYRASMAGAVIDLYVRGVCCLRPGIPGVSENIRVHSILGRFLEHERVFVFGAPGEEQFFLSSADWMPRNLHRRVEVMFPVESARLRQQIRQEVIEPAAADNASAYEMNVDGAYVRRAPPEDQPPRSAQPDALDRVLRRSLRAVTPA